MAEGFQIQDFKIDSTFPSLRAAIDSRDRHIEMHDLIQSMKDHAEIRLLSMERSLSSHLEMVRRGCLSVSDIS
jgi:hypothetical protein